MPSQDVGPTYAKCVESARTRQVIKVTYLRDDAMALISGQYPLNLDRRAVSDTGSLSDIAQLCTGRRFYGGLGQ